MSECAASRSACRRDRCQRCPIRGQMLEARRVQIERWLKQDEPLTLVRIYELLARDGTEVSYATLRRWA